MQDAAQAASGRPSINQESREGAEPPRAGLGMIAGFKSSLREIAVLGGEQGYPSEKRVCNEGTSNLYRAGARLRRFAR